VHLSATGAALLGLRFDQSGGFFPFEIAVVPLGAVALAAVGLIACRSAALRCCVLAWLAFVIAGNVMRAEFIVYAPVLICAVPPLALAAAWSARWLRWLAPVIAVAIMIQPIRDYFAAGRSVPASEALPMAQAAAIEQHSDADGVFVAGGLGCEHGLTVWALHGRPCFAVGTAELSAAAPAQLFIVYPPYFAQDAVLDTRADLILTTERWAGTRVHVWAHP
jgi:hypothetical protein